MLSAHIASVVTSAALAVTHSLHDALKGRTSGSCKGAWAESSLRRLVQGLGRGVAQPCLWILVYGSQCLFMRLLCTHVVLCWHAVLLVLHVAHLSRRLACVFLLQPQAWHGLA
jgi:hypothetical protein